MFMDELMACRKSPSPPTRVRKFRCSPPTASLGSKATTRDIIDMGSKQEMNSAEIITTILETFRLRIVITEFAVFVTDCNQPALLRRKMTRIIVHSAIMMKARMGMRNVLIMKEIFSTFPRSAVKVRPKIVMLVPGMSFIPSLLTT